MAGVRLTLNASGLDQLKGRVEGLGDMDTSSLMPQLGEYLLHSSRERFKTQTDPDGGPWAALAPRTLARKRRNRDKILTLSGHLRSRGLHYKVTSPSRVEVFSSAIYGATHQFGRDKIPARPFLGIGRDDIEELNAIVRDWAAENGYD